MQAQDEVIKLLESAIDEFQRLITNKFENAAIDKVRQALAKLKEEPEPTAKCADCVYLEADGEIINAHIEKEIALEKIIDRLQAEIKKLVEGQKAKQ